jgi:23S rRNA (adenine1618-N6)-methyltransferase
MPNPAAKNTKSATLHPRNLHQGHYDFQRLCKDHPALKSFVRSNPKGEATIDFHNPKAVQTFNQALLRSYYGIEYWQLPIHALCPPIPGRVDYIHHLADLLKNQYGLRSPKQPATRVLDVGTGASLIYPLLGRQCYGWQFTASDVSEASLASSQTIIDQNPVLAGIQLRHQSNPECIFEGIIQQEEFYHLTLCNPPFHASQREAEQGTMRKNTNLHKRSHGPQTSKNISALNFGGQSHELWCPGGERAFITRMIHESEQYQKQVGWFTSLVSKSDNLAPLKKILKKGPVKEIKVVKMAQGQKVSRFLAWTFQSPDDLRKLNKVF